MRLSDQDFATHMNAWLEVIAGAGIEDQNWGRDKGTNSPYAKAKLRNKDGSCPLCAMAFELKAHEWHEAWKWAIEAAFGKLGTIDEAICRNIAFAADLPQHPWAEALELAVNGIVPEGGYKPKGQS